MHTHTRERARTLTHAHTHMHVLYCLPTMKAPDPTTRHGLGAPPPTRRSSQTRCPAHVQQAACSAQQARRRLVYDHARPKVQSRSTQPAMPSMQHATLSVQRHTIYNMRQPCSSSSPAPSAIEYDARPPLLSLCPPAPAPRRKPSLPPSPTNVLPLPLPVSLSSQTQHTHTHSLSLSLSPLSLAHS